MAPARAVLRNWFFLALTCVLLAPSVLCTCSPTLIFTGEPPEQAELLPITDMTSRSFLTFNVTSCKIFLALSLSNSSAIIGSASRRISLDYGSGFVCLWECTDASTCTTVICASRTLTCNQTTGYWMWWSTTRVIFGYQPWNWYTGIVDYTWTKELNITHLWKPAVTGYFQGSFDAPFLERCCSSSSSKTDSKICTSEQQATSKAAPTTLESTSSKLVATTSKLQITTETASENKITTPTTESTASYITAQPSTADTSSEQTASDEDTDAFTTVLADGGTASNGAENVGTGLAVLDVSSGQTKSGSSAMTTPATNVSEEAPVATEAGAQSPTYRTRDDEKTSPEPSATGVRLSSSSPEPLDENPTPKTGSDTSDIRRRWCACRCSTKASMLAASEDFRNQLQANLSQEVRDALALPRGQLSAQIRAKTSAPDQRVSSTSAGALAIVVISLVLVSLLVGDLLTLVQFLYGVTKNGNRLPGV